MQEQIDNLQKQLDELKAMYLKDNFEAKQIFRKETEFVGQTSFSGKIGFYGDVPVAQGAAVSTVGAPSGVYVQAEAASAATAINSLISRLQSYGLLP